MREKTLKDLAVEEATLLRKHLTREEKTKLIPGLINPHHGKTCIYGMVTGDCYSQRATELLNLCTKPYCHDITDLPQDVQPHHQQFIVGWKRDHSPLEMFITLPEADIPKICKYLKS